MNKQQLSTILAKACFGCGNGWQAALPVPPTSTSPNELLANSRRFIMRIPVQIFSFLISVFAALILAGCAATGDTRIDNIPMYGQPNIQRPDELKRADEDFIKQASEGLGGNKKASQAWALQGDKFLGEGNLDFAMRRYNQSWLLDQNNYQAYWGFGRVMLQRGKVEEAIQNLEKSRQLVEDQLQKAALLSDLGSAYSVHAENVPSSSNQNRARLFLMANQCFSESTVLDPSYGNSWRRWAMSLYEQENYIGAWEKVKRARKENARPFPAAFIHALEQKMPEPK